MKLHHPHSRHHVHPGTMEASSQPTVDTESSQPATGAESSPSTIDADSSTRGQSKGYVVIAIVYLLGLCIGALDMGIVNPARTVIQNTLDVDNSLGVWVITIYTLAYAASIPIMGKLADRHGRKYIYLTCIVLFGAGSALCGVAHNVGSFELLICARAIQALGGGGIVPVATAEFGTAFPEEKRGMALGLVGMVYGLASIFGSSAGSLILDVFGQTQWQFIFYVNIPICIVILALGILKLPNRKADQVPPIDILGACVLTLMTLSLMYGLKNIDFFELGESITSTDVYPFLIISVVLLPIFILVERRAKDPIMNLSYFSNPNIIITLICSIISGVIMMGTIFFPQFAENSLLLKSGSGGYFIMILGLASGLGAMLSGKLIDRFGVKPVLAIGFVGSLAGSLFMAFVACKYPNIVNVCVMLALTGAGLGFTMGTPLNYMMLQNAKDEESNSALATLSLVRSMGTAVAPAIMVAFVAHAGLSMQDNIMAVLPDEVSVSPLPHAVELDNRLDEIRGNDRMASMLDGIDIPKLSSYETVSVQRDGASSEFDVEVSDEMLQKMRDSDVTTIVGTCKDMSAEMFEQIKPQLIEKATGGIDKGIAAMQDGLDEMDNALSAMQGAMGNMDTSAMGAGVGAMAGMDAGAMGGMDAGAMGAGASGASAQGEALSSMQDAHDELADTISKLEDVKAAIPGMFDEAEANYLEEIDAVGPEIQEVYRSTLNDGFRGMALFVAACALVGLIVLIPYRESKR